MEAAAHFSQHPRRQPKQAQRWCYTCGTSEEPGAAVVGQRAPPRGLLGSPAENSTSVRRGDRDVVVEVLLVGVAEGPEGSVWRSASRPGCAGSLGLEAGQGAEGRRGWQKRAVRRPHARSWWSVSGAWSHSWRDHLLTVLSGARSIEGDFSGKRQ